MTITIGMAEYREVMDTIRRVGTTGIHWLDCVYLRSVEDNMLLVTVGNRHVQHFIEFYVHGVHREIGDEVIGIPFEVLHMTDRAARSARFLRGSSVVTVGWEVAEGGTVIGRIEAERYAANDPSPDASIGYQTFEGVKQQSDVLDVCAPHFYAEDAARFRVEDAGLLARRVKTASRMFERDDRKECTIGWSSASVMNIELLKEYNWQVVINSRMTGPDYSSVVEQFSPVNFNPELLAEVLGIDDRVVISLKKDLKGCLFTAGYHTALLMPIRTNNTY